MLNRTVVFRNFFLGCLVCAVLFSASRIPGVTASTGTAPGGTLSEADRTRAVKYLEETKQKFVDSVAGLSEAQWKFKPAPEVWSVAEVAEHITLSETLLLGLVTERILKSPAAPKGEATDDAVIAKITDRSTKVKAPEILVPSGKWATRDELVKAFGENRAKTIDYVKTTQDDLHGHSLLHPAFNGNLDGYQWVLLLAAHTARHTAQINEVKADAKFPKS